MRSFLVRPLEFEQPAVLGGPRFGKLLPSSAQGRLRPPAQRGLACDDVDGIPGDEDESRGRKEFREQLDGPVISAVSNLLETPVSLSIPGGWKNDSIKPAKFAATSRLPYQFIQL